MHKVPQLSGEYGASTVDWQSRRRHDDVELLLEVAGRSLQEPQYQILTVTVTEHRQLPETADGNMRQPLIASSL